MNTEFNQTIDIVRTSSLPKTIPLSQEAESKLYETLTIREAKKLLDQTGYGFLANIPLMIALISGGSQKYEVDYKKLFDAIVSQKESLPGKITKSYNEVMDIVSARGVGNIQGVKLFAEYKRRLLLFLHEINSSSDYIYLRSATDDLIKFLQIAYVLMGRRS